MDKTFISVVRQAVSQERKAGRINFRQSARILAAVSLTRLGAEVELLASAELALEPTSSGLIDWDTFDPEKFLALIEAILKILLQYGLI